MRRATRFDPSVRFPPTLAASAFDPLRTLRNSAIVKLASVGAANVSRYGKHVLGLVLPLAVSSIVLALAPEYDAPDWMITLSVAGIIIALAYGYVQVEFWMRRHRDHTVVSVALLAVGLLGWVLGVALGSLVLQALLGLVPVAMAVLLSGFLARRMDGPQLPPEQ